ncbi:MAG: hypothetical protein SZ59_C0001G0184 [candidate division TM6 bacterium GW2011_GWF2_28_16]|nr:MAG: hypothetical protein SZ59_C0001G0184 [candidate division TM6 bacterium GW2011_GWF2_28_16]
MVRTENGIEKILPKQALIVTGLSGAGKTIFIRTLEDYGFYCVDNLPVPLLSTFLNLAHHGQHNLTKVALSIDARSKKFLSDFVSFLQDIRNQEKDRWDLKIIFLNASTNTITKRFQETKRNHPLMTQDIGLAQAITQEQALLEPIKAMADIVLDTDVFNVHELRDWVKRSLSTTFEQQILVNLISFGFKYGVPTESNLVYDLRFLPNPYFEPALKHLDGRNDLIKKYLFEKESVNEYWNLLRDFLQYSTQKFYNNGRFFVNIGIGCTGGKHRSVAFVERLLLEKWENTRFLVTHRDLGKE